MGKVRKKCVARVHISAAKVSSNELRDDHHGRETVKYFTLFLFLCTCFGMVDHFHNSLILNDNVLYL